MRWAVNVEICLVHHSLEDFLAQIDPASLGKRLQFVSSLSGKRRYHTI